MDTSDKRPSIKDLMALTSGLVQPFMQVYRATPLRSKPPRNENDAEHSWSVAFVACALAPHIDSSLDVGMVAQFAIVHDLVEIYAGDTSNFADDAEKQTKETREHAALEKIADNFPSFPWISQTIMDYEHQELAEAKFVKAVDKILLLLFDIVDEGRFYKDSHITLEEWKRVMQKHREKASKHAGIFVYYDELWSLLLANPQFFYGYDKGTL